MNDNIPNNVVPSCGTFVDSSIRCESSDDFEDSSTQQSGHHENCSEDSLRSRGNHNDESCSNGPRAIHSVGINRLPSLRFRRTCSNVEATESTLSHQQYQEKHQNSNSKEIAYSLSRRTKSFGGVTASQVLQSSSIFNCSSSIMQKNSDDDNSTEHPEIKHTDTFDSSNMSESRGIDVGTLNDESERHEFCAAKIMRSADIFNTSQPTSILNVKQRSIRIDLDNDEHEFRLRRLISELGAATQKHEDDHVIEWDVVIPYMYYISTFGVLGTVLRIYMGRFFGLDCERKNSGDEMADFFSTISSGICITASGTTKQTGGALFIDLPANMLGSFIMGLINPSFRPDQPLQCNDEVYMGLKFGFCGCLTTFASWNTQMVVMMDGTDTELGSQIAPALFGYVIGIAGSLSSFLFGRQIADWLKTTDFSCRFASNSNYQNQTIDNAIQQSTSGMQSQDLNSHALGVRWAPLLTSLCLLTAFVVGDVIGGVEFYRRMWLSILFTPVGAMLRWTLSKLNAKGLSLGDLSWFPLGTFICNVFAAAVSIIAIATEARNNNAASIVWTAPLLEAIGGGFAGSLSTVSTLVKEMACISNPMRAHGYCLLTILVSLMIGLILYRPIVRSG